MGFHTQVSFSFMPPGTSSQTKVQHEVLNVQVPGIFLPFKFQDPLDSCAFKELWLIRVDEILQYARLVLHDVVQVQAASVNRQGCVWSFRRATT